jgi:hypothetical protein
VLTKLLTVDGTGSGLDADLLDGQSGAHYLARANHTGSQAASTISDFSTAADARISAAVGVSVQAYDADLASWSAIAPAAKLDASAYTAADVLAKLLTVDGSGSGLDADLLDGQSSAAFATLASPTFTGDPKSVTPTAGDNDTSIATTAFVATSFAPLASPTFTGTPLSTTAASTVNTTQIATTAFVKSNLAVKVTVASSAPGSPATNDVWIDTT